MALLLVPLLALLSEAVLQDEDCLSLATLRGTPGANVQQLGPKLHQRPVVNKACPHCCYHGENEVPCLDVEQCAEKGPTNGRYAIVMTYVGQPHDKMLPYIRSMQAAAAMANNADIVMAMRKSDSEQMTQNQKELFRNHSIKLLDVDWDTPPKMKAYQEGAWCGHQDFIRLHVLGMEGYDAVAYYDTDVEFQGDITPVLRCAASGKFLTTNGGLGELLNVGFFALRPDKRLFQAAVNFALHANFSMNTSWGEMGWTPAGGYFVGGECGQGFWYALFYKFGGSAQQALQSAGLSVVDSAQIDRCMWNYQTSFQCKEHLDCSRVRVHHKPAIKTEWKECQKLEPSVR
ncbi:unnamed protein product [Effrenium voratum]|uniref:Hexosyltransferase n=2 Tax=Effrenium voratum TaxID=2562239 RepID=A0AA36MS94_9DINO|nr:unnamed protein product [Effrenium voratum]